MKKTPLDILSETCLANRCEVLITTEQRNETYHRFGVSVPADRTVAHQIWNDIYYATKQRHVLSQVEKLAKDFPVQAAAIRPAAEAALVYLAEQDVARKAKKAELEARRAARSAKATKKAELGVALPVDVSEEDYKVIHKSIQSLLPSLTGQYAEALRAQERAYARKYPSRTPRDEQEIRQDARAHAKVALASFAAKIAGKVAEREGGGYVVAAELSASGDPRAWSKIQVRLTDGRVMVFVTTTILNTSVLGKIFNQWPTRLES